MRAAGVGGGCAKVEADDGWRREEREAERTYERGAEKVFQYNWYHVYPPTSEDYAKAHERGWDYVPAK